MALVLKLKKYWNNNGLETENYQSKFKSNHTTSKHMELEFAFDITQLNSSIIPCDVSIKCFQIV